MQRGSEFKVLPASASKMI